MTLTVDTQRLYETDYDYNDLPVAASSLIFEGCAVGDNASGYMRKLVAGDDFRGFADRQADNSLGAAGDINVRLRRRGAVTLAISGLAITDVDAPIYASDDGTFTKTATSNSYVGRVIRFVSSGIGIVAYDVSKGGVAELAALTDTSGGVAAAGIVDVGAAFSQATLNANFTTIVGKLNALLAMVK